MDPSPPYSEKNLDNFQPGPSSNTLAQSLSTARSNRIEETIITSIYPQLESSAHRGIARTTLVLLPCDQSSRLSLDSKEQADAAAVIGFPSDEFVQLLQLPQSAGTLEFWRQKNVIPELVSRLKATLAAAGSRVRSDIVETPVLVPSPPVIPVQTPSRGFFRRNPSKQKQPLPDVEGVDADISGVQLRLAPGEIDVSAAVQDVSFRTVTEMGLYETRNDKGIVVRMEIGT